MESEMNWRTVKFSGDVIDVDFQKDRPESTSTEEGAVAPVLPFKSRPKRPPVPPTSEGEAAPSYTQDSKFFEDRSNPCSNCGYHKFYTSFPNGNSAMCVRCLQDNSWPDGTIRSLPDAHVESITTNLEGKSADPSLRNVNMCSKCGLEIDPEGNGECDHHGFELGTCTECWNIRAFNLQRTGQLWVPGLVLQHMRFHPHPVTGKYYDKSLFRKYED